MNERRLRVDYWPLTLALLQLDPMFGARENLKGAVAMVLQANRELAEEIVARRRSCTRTASLGAGLRGGSIAEQADAGPRAGALLALRIGQQREKAQPGSEALQSRGSL
jgi:hypothetical protein